MLRFFFFSKSSLDPQPERAEGCVRVCPLATSSCLPVEKSDDIITTLFQLLRGSSFVLSVTGSQKKKFCKTQASKRCAIKDGQTSR